MAYSAEHRRAYLTVMDRVSDAWIRTFDDDLVFRSAAYWDLFTGLWRTGTPFRKTDALRLMRGIKSAHTALKHVEEALAAGLLVESDNPDDARSRLVALAPATAQRLDAFFDEAVGAMLETSREIDRGVS